MSLHDSSASYWTSKNGLPCDLSKMPEAITRWPLLVELQYWLSRLQRVRLPYRPSFRFLWIMRVLILEIFGRFVLECPSSQTPHRQRCPEPTPTCHWPPEFGKRRWLLAGSHVRPTWKLGRSGKTHGEWQDNLDNRRPRDGNRGLGNLLQNPIRHFLNWMLSAEIVCRFAEIVCTLPTSALTSKLSEWTAKIECTTPKVGVSTPNKVR